MKLWTVLVVVVLVAQRARCQNATASTGAANTTTTIVPAKASRASESVLGYPVKLLNLGYSYNVSVDANEPSYFLLNQAITKADIFHFLISLDLSDGISASVRFVPLKEDASFDGTWKNVVNATGDRQALLDQVPVAQKYLFEVKMTCAAENCTEYGLFGVFLKHQDDFEPFELLFNKQVAEYCLVKKEDWAPTSFFQLNNNGSLYIRVVVTNANESLSNNQSAIIGFVAWIPSDDSTAVQLNFNFTHDEQEQMLSIPNLSADYEWYLEPQLVQGRNVSFVYTTNADSEPISVYSPSMKSRSEKANSKAAEAEADSVETMAETHPDHPKEVESGTTGEHAATGGGAKSSKAGAGHISPSWVGLFALFAVLAI